jgi:hypothetical protein
MREKGREGDCVWKSELSGAKGHFFVYKNQNDDTHGLKNTKRYELTIYIQYLIGESHEFKVSHNFFME